MKIRLIVLLVILILACVFYYIADKKSKINAEKKYGSLIEKIKNNLDIDSEFIKKIKFKAAMGFSANPKENTIYWSKKIENYKDFEIRFALGHEVAHFVYSKIDRQHTIDVIINELFCDLKGREISCLNDKEIDEFFTNHKTRIKTNNSYSQTIDKGYFPLDTRKYFAKKYFLDFLTEKINCQELAIDIMERYNKADIRYQITEVNSIIKILKKYL